VLVRREVPELTRSGTIKLNTRLSLRRDVGSVTCLRRRSVETTARHSSKGYTPPSPAFTADLEGQVMSDKKHTHEARKAFRSSEKKETLTEHEEKQKALLKNLERLKAERLAREAAKSKDD
jgi:hypothetical protein